LDDASALEQNREAKNIAAHRIRNLNGDRRWRKFTNVARIPEMLDQFRGHRRRCTGQPTISRAKLLQSS